jgi:hypothetical protein
VVPEEGSTLWSFRRLQYSARLKYKTFGVGFQISETAVHLDTTWIEYFVYIVYMGSLVGMKLLTSNALSCTSNSGL